MIRCSGLSEHILLLLKGFNRAFGSKRNKFGTILSAKELHGYYTPVSIVEWVRQKLVFVIRPRLEAALPCGAVFAPGLHIPTRFFQVINHGVSENLMNEIRNVMKEFFEMSDDYKQNLYSEDPTKKCKLITSDQRYPNQKPYLWRDALRHPCRPLEPWQQFWPEKPTNYRECVGNCTIEVKKLASRILGLIGEGLGLQAGYFDNELTESMLLSASYYPPCPEPSLTLGLPKHADPNIVTILLQNDVYGLQVLKDGNWIGVDPLPNAFVVNCGYELQIISNGRLKSVQHRVITNSSNARITAAFFVAPLEGAIIEPAKALTNQIHPPLFKSVKSKDFLTQYYASSDTVLQYFKA
ncbi:hypothetical protein L6164_000079 [Bauhinia variegata]|uniref:Uncharacterized protein n=1 Tax=Bauhinia variegata TaxID=167791 RepID=A0ACB9Q618_BAUVA|nr:hypothetical protein L6164_000079 [Bauhinia variegata]